jgi:hypothetical protein
MVLALAGDSTITKVPPPRLDDRFVDGSVETSALPSAVLVAAPVALLVLARGFFSAEPPLAAALIRGFFSVDASDAGFLTRVFFSTGRSEEAVFA